MCEKPFPLDPNTPPEAQLLQLYEEYCAFCRALSFLCMAAASREENQLWLDKAAAQSLTLFCDSLKARSDEMLLESQQVLEVIKAELVACDVPQ